LQQLLGGIDRMQAAQVGDVALHIGRLHGLSEGIEWPQQVMGIGTQKPGAEALCLVLPAGRQGSIGGQHQEPVALFRLTLALIQVSKIFIHLPGMFGVCHGQPPQATAWY
jgi:hypothetical protein